VDTNIEHLDTNYFDEIAADLFLMSPPCQPYTRAGKQLDTKDKRANALVHLAHLIRDMKSPPKFILLENVKNFERSDSCKILLECLAVANYSFQEFILSPVQFGIPNERVRYFLIAKRVPFEYADCLERGNYLMTFIPKNDWFDGDLAVYKLERVVSDSESKNEDYESYQIIPEDKPPLVSQNTIQKTRQIATFLEENVSFEEYKVPDAILQKSVGYCFDIVKSDSIRSACFTKVHFR
jgi:tRNA (cytosine38-C5)-methyltransferase